MSNSGKKNRMIEAIDATLSHIIERNLGHLHTEDTEISGRFLQINNKKMLNFGSCSYLGLELDPRLKQGAINAINHYGTQFSSSRGYISCGLYVELENLLAELFGSPVLVTPTTTLAHQSALPVIINDSDCVIIDNQAHASIHVASNLLKTRGIPTHVIPHSDMQQLEMLIEQHRGQYENIWYLADGIYSMYGDQMPLDKISVLLNKYKCFHAYIDDAHGASWTGENGKGSVLGAMSIHPRMVVALSLSKSFGAGGGALVFPNEELKRKVRTCGGPMIFSGPLQPANLGALIESTKIHLSDEIHGLQQDLMERIEHFNTVCEQYALPLLGESNVPIRYIGLGLHRVMYNMVEKLFNDGYYVNFGIFPAVPMKGAGLRVALNRHIQLEDISALVSRIAHYLPIVFQEEGRALSDIGRFFWVKIIV